MKNLIQTLHAINWDFSDYSSRHFPLDVNSIPWYPATFPPPIPKFLIALLTEPGDVVFDPFGGSGTAIIEAIKQNRLFLYNDLNPFVTDTVSDFVDILRESSLDSQLICSVRDQDVGVLSGRIGRICREDVYEGKSITTVREKYSQEMMTRIESLGLDEEVILWYHIDTLNELLMIYELIQKEQESGESHIRKCAFTSILKDVCSQRGHFTYITDNCKPSLLQYYSTFSAYINMLDRLHLSISDFLRQFAVVYGTANLTDLIGKSVINCGDARKLDWLEDESVDFILTSPPYLCAQDYVKTMRLIYLFFPDEGFNRLPSQEIGTRACRKRKGPEIVNKFYGDMATFFGEAERVLKKGKFFCLIIGQGKAKAIEDYDTIGDLTNMATCDFQFQKIFETSRAISHKWNRLGGVDHEKIIIFQKS